jgi:N-acetylmuramoyl-L-alanine amidase
MQQSQQTAIRAAIFLLGVPGFCLGLLAAVPLAVAQNPQAIPMASASRLGGDDTRTRFVLDLDREVPFHVFALADPYRVIIDLPQINFQMPSNSGQSGRGLVSAYRYGLFARGKSRIVLDIDGPARIDKAFALAPEAGQPARLVIDLVATSREAFLQEMSRLQTARAPPRPAEAPGLHRGDSRELVIVIDPGHGGIDGGAVGPGGELEKDLVLEFARTLKSQLEEVGRYKVLLTRDDDIFLSLRERVEFARRNGADLFISVHADKFSTESVSGATVYTVSERASDAETAALAAKENKADLIAGLDLEDEPDEVTDILIDLTRRETKNFSVRLAERLVSSLRGSIRLNKNPHRYAGFRVLKAPDVPSVLIELGYISNSNDVRELNSSAWRTRAATAIARALKRYFSS